MSNEFAQPLAGPSHLPVRAKNPLWAADLRQASAAPIAPRTPCRRTLGRLPQAPHSDKYRLTSQIPKIILSTYKIDVHWFAVIMALSRRRRSSVGGLGGRGAGGGAARWTSA
ncbi:MAG: hypothetical protein WB688_11775, partial [Trebonia sp.]